MSKPKLFYVYYQDSKISEYTHPEFRVFLQDPRYSSCQEELCSIRFQTDRDNGHKLRKAYAMYTTIPQGYDMKHTMSLVSKIVEGIYSYDKPCIALIKRLRKLGIERRMWLPIEGNQYNKQAIPASFRNDADLYWSAVQKGLTLTKKRRIRK